MFAKLQLLHGKLREQWHNCDIISITWKRGMFKKNNDDKRGLYLKFSNLHYFSCILPGLVDLNNECACMWVRAHVLRFCIRFACI